MDEVSATLATAVLGAFVALMTLIVTKEQQTSEFRQTWIDGLRADIAEAISAGSTLTTILQVRADEPNEAQLREWARLAAALARMELRLNLSEDPHKELEKCIRRAEVLLRRLEADSNDYDQQEWISLSNDVVQKSQALLKIEWDRVRVGEPIFRRTKKALFWGGSTAGAAIIVYAIASAILS
jgi:hypothetical protein